MKRAEITGPNKPLAVTSHPIPEPPSKGLVLKTLYSGICHTDLHVIEDDIDIGNGKAIRVRDVLGDKYIGLVPGHEILGVIHSLGADVGAECPHKVGDTVLIYPWRGCRECDNCKVGDCHLCEFNKGTTTDFGKGPVAGGFCSHIQIPEWEIAVKAPEGIPPELACTLPCSALTSYSVMKRARPFLERARKVRGRANVLIMGAGGLGIWGIVLLKEILKEECHVICADISQDKLDAAKEAGADETVLWADHEASVEAVAALTTRNGECLIDAAIDYVGLPRTSTIAFNTLHRGATLICVGLHGGQLPVPIPVLIGKSITVQGNRTGSLSSLHELVELVKATPNFKPPTLDLVPLDNVNMAIQKLYKGEYKGRAILTFD